MLDKILLPIKVVLYYTLGHVLGWFFYDSKYLTGRWFSRRFDGFGSRGWEWVTISSLSNFLLGRNKGVMFPVSSACTVINYENIEFHPDDLNNFQSYGIYFQAFGRIKIGRGSYIGPNVGLITANHDPANLSQHLPAKDIVLGSNCWIGMNAVVMGGVVLGDNTTVGAGSIVTKSFPEGNCIIAGNPARIIRQI